MNLRLQSILVSLMLSALGVGAQETKTATPVADEDAAQIKFIWEGQRLLDAKKPQEAITGSLDKVITYFENKYHDKKEQIYCSRTQAETLAYLFSAAAKQQNAVVLNFAWAEAHYMKGFAYLDLEKVPEAKASLEKALQLSPRNSQFLSELGQCFQLEKNWARALELYTAAEEAAKATSPDDRKMAERTRALRGQGYVLVEQGELDRATKKFEECLMLNPDDKTAKGELDYIRGLEKK